MDAVPNALRKPVVIAAGSAALLSATFAWSPFAGASDSPDAASAAVLTPVVCTLTAAECGGATGEGITASRLPDGFAELAPPAELVRSNPGVAARMRVFESPDKPWIGPAGPFGPRVTVTIRTSETPTLRSLLLDVTKVPGAALSRLGDNKAMVSGRSVPVRTRTGAAVEVASSSVTVAVNDRVMVQITGEGVTADRLLSFATGLEVR